MKISKLIPVVTMFAAACGDPTPPTESTGESLPDSAVSQIEALLAEKASRTPVQRKIGSQLLYAAQQRFALPKDFVSLAKTDADGRVLVDIARSDGHVRTYLALDQLEQVAADPAVLSIWPALGATTWRADAPAAALVGTGSVTSSGATAHAATRARKYYDVDGTGVTVGVLSDSNDHQEEAIASGDLPADTIAIPGQDGRPGTGEGTAMMEIVHDMAPGAKLVFATAYGGPDGFAANIRALRFTYHCDVIVDDVSYFSESPYQDDVIAQAVDDVYADGALYFSSAGNEGHFDDGTSGTWEGDFRSAGTLATLPSGTTVLDFGNRVISDRIEKQGGPVVLYWSDPSTIDAPQAADDYDLFLLDEDLRNVVVASTDIQSGTQLPFEELAYLIPPNYRVVIAKHSAATTRALHVQLLGGELGIATAGASYGHSAANGAISVAAVDVAEAGGGEFKAGPTTPVELFSSDGYRRVFYDRAGTLLGTGPTIASTGGQTRKKPDLTGADGVVTTLPAGSGLDVFYGTSAAAPHAAGIAALMKSAVPAATAPQLHDALLLGALDIAASSQDRDSGKGIASAMNGLSRAGAVKAVFLELGSVAVTPTTSDAVLPGGGGRIAITLHDSGGASASAITATLSSTSPDVTITQATSTFPSVTSGHDTVAATAFQFTVTTAALCGSALPFTLTVNFTGVGTHPTQLPFTVQLGRPAAPTAFTWSGVTAIPDNAATGVDIPLAVSLATPLSKLQLAIGGTSCSTTIGATTVGIDHAFDGDLVLKLRSPSGRMVTLASRPGGTLNNGHNFCQTTFDDTATTSIQTVTSAGAPYTGSFAPAQGLGAFAGDSATGTWTLNVSDNAAGDIGNVRAFTIYASGYSCTP